MGNSPENLTWTTAAPAPCWVAANIPGVPRVGAVLRLPSAFQGGKKYESLPVISLSPLLASCPFSSFTSFRKVLGINNYEWILVTTSLSQRKFCFCSLISHLLDQNTKSSHSYLLEAKGLNPAHMYFQGLPPSLIPSPVSLPVDYSCLISAQRPWTTCTHPHISYFHESTDSAPSAGIYFIHSNTASALDPVQRSPPPKRPPRSQSWK